MREIRTYGSVRGALSNERPYRVRNGQLSSTAALHTPFPSRVNSLHYRAAALLSASPQSTDAISSRRLGWVVPEADYRRQSLGTRASRAQYRLL